MIPTGEQIKKNRSWIKLGGVRSSGKYVSFCDGSERNVVVVRFSRRIKRHIEDEPDAVAKLATSRRVSRELVVTLP